MSVANKFALALIIASFAFLIPGLILPLITIKASVSMMGFHAELFNETKSILETVSSLYSDGHWFVSVLVMLFSVIVPVTKSIMLWGVMLHPSILWRTRLHKMINIISKWSMADVYVVGLFVAFLSMQASKNMTAELHEGFYYFTAYCLLSIASTQILSVPIEAERMTSNNKK